MKTFALSFLSIVFTFASLDVFATNVWTGYKDVTEVQVVEDGAFRSRDRDEGERAVRRQHVFLLRKISASGTLV